MTSTSRTFTGFVPESITGGSAAGQDSGDRYRSLLEMKRTTEFADQPKYGDTASDQHIHLPGSTEPYRALPARVVPDLYRRATRVLLFIVAATLIPALGMAIGAVGSELAHRASAEQAAAEYPVAYPSIDQVQVLADTVAVVPSLGIDWRWAELDSRPACGTAILRARIVLLDPDMRCDLRVTIWHEWTHIAQVEYYGGESTPSGTITSDLIDEDTGRPYEVDVQEASADCASLLLADEFATGVAPHSYLPRLGGCPPDMLGLAREIVTHAGVQLTPGTASALGSVGAGVA